MGKLRISCWRRVEKVEIAPFALVNSLCEHMTLRRLWIIDRGATWILSRIPPRLIEGPGDARGPRMDVFWGAYLKDLVADSRGVSVVLKLENEAIFAVRRMR